MGILRDLDQFVVWDEIRQMYMPHYWRKDFLPAWLCLDPNDPRVVNGRITINAAGTPTAPTSFKQPYASVEGLDDGLGTPFEARNIMFEDSTDGTAAAAFTVLLTEFGERRQLMNRACHIRTMAGTAQTPLLLREPLFIPSRHVIQATFNKITGGATNIRMTFGGGQYYPWSPELMRYRDAGKIIKDRIRQWMQRRETVLPFWLTTDTDIAMVGSDTQNFLLKPGNDAQYEIFTAAMVSTGDFAWSLEDAKTYQTLMNGQVSVATVGGNANFPTIFDTPYVLPADKRLRLRITDLSGAPNAVFFTLGGRKIYTPFMEMREALFDTAVPTPADSQALIVPAPME